MIKRSFIAILSFSLFFAGYVFAGAPISVKTDLTEIVIPVKHDAGDSYEIPMKDGVAWWFNETDSPCGFFTYEALEKVWKEKNLKLQKPLYNTPGYPGGLEKGLFLVTWDEKTKKGSVIPVIFNFLGVGMADAKGGFWHKGEFWISQDPKDWLANGEPIFWEPQTPTTTE